MLGSLCFVICGGQLDNGSQVCEKLYFPLAEEQNKWKMFSLTPLGPGPEGLFFESRAQCCLSVAFLLSAIADIFQSPSSHPTLRLS